MTAEKYVKQSREELRQKFGKVGKKEDCVYYDAERGNSCKVCKLDRERRCLPCELGVCYFYKTEGV